MSGGAVDGGGGAAAAEASTTTVRTVIHGDVSTSLGSEGNQDQAAGVLDGFDGVALDAQAAAEIDAALLALAARQREIDAAIEAGDVDAVAMQIDDPATPLVRLGERASPYYGPLQMGEGPADPEPVLRIAGGGVAGCRAGRGGGGKEAAAAETGRGGRVIAAAVRPDRGPWARGPNGAACRSSRMR